jgi:hypothetical protein
VTLCNRCLVAKELFGVFGGRALFSGWTGTTLSKALGLVPRGMTFVRYQ